MAQHGYLGCGVPHKVITRREPPNCESQNIEGRAHLAGRLAIHEVTRVLQVLCGLIVVATMKIQILRLSISASRNRAPRGLSSP